MPHWLACARSYKVSHLSIAGFPRISRQVSASLYWPSADAHSDLQSPPLPKILLGIICGVAMLYFEPVAAVTKFGMHMRKGGDGGGGGGGGGGEYRHQFTVLVFVYSLPPLHVRISARSMGVHRSNAGPGV